ncbi:hypothetical protein EJ08DRAFT_485515 [Tothia fuscella]|uniref:Uncharacterized protein n=1 Tax=Tothia fuscella TaxID=1048955 RepID=A0A9P4NHT7_9PEZI|nr:hypothetical protein EJ08DRAFT_485515 [Tothia fuscella]
MPPISPPEIHQRTIGRKKDEYSLGRRNPTKGNVMNLFESDRPCMLQSILHCASGSCYNTYQREGSRMFGSASRNTRGMWAAGSGGGLLPWCGPWAGESVERLGALGLRGALLVLLGGRDEAIVGI